MLPLNELMNRDIPPYKLYCDMDGVLTDFDASFFELAGMNPDVFEAKYGRKLFWEIIDQAGWKFWANLRWTPFGVKLWEFIKDYEPTLLTSPSKSSQESRIGKLNWVQNNLLPVPNIIFKYSKVKHHYAMPNAIHIDDREDIIRNWNDAGGIGIHDPKNGDSQIVIDKLKELGYS